MRANKLEKKEKYFLYSQFLLGILAIGFGIFVMSYPAIFWQYVSYFSLVIVGVVGLFFFYRSVVHKNLYDALIGLGSIFMIIAILVNDSFISSVISLFFGIWALFNAASHGVDIYVSLKLGKNFPIVQVVLLLFEIVLGILLIITYNNESFGIAEIEIGFYVILIGITQLYSASRVLFRNKSMLYLPAPVFISAIMPSLEVRRIENVKKENPGLITKEIKPTTGNQISIYIYGNTKGFDSMGHMGIGYKGKIYNYGNHDPFNRSKTMIFGDGVMIVGKEEDHVDFAVDWGNTLFRFVCELTPEQEEIIDKQFEELFEPAYEYYYPSEKDTKRQHYLSWVEDFGCESKYYKFSSGQFKTYSVLTTNCVLITDHIFQTTGMKFFQLSGIISPGAYYDYLNGVLNKPGSIVKHKYIYQK